MIFATQEGSPVYLAAIAGFLSPGRIVFLLWRPVAISAAAITLFGSILVWPPPLSVGVSLVGLFALLFIFGDITKADLAAVRQMFSVRPSA